MSQLPAVVEALTGLNMISLLKNLPWVKAATNGEEKKPLPEGPEKEPPAAVS
jgi:hypothetical protein